MKRWGWLLLLLFGLDIATKLLAIHFIPPLGGGSYPFGGIPVASFGGVTFSLNYIANTGMAWGIFAGYPGLLFAIRVVILFGLIFFAPKQFPIWLIITGAFGNVLDYCLYGQVIDFIHFTFWGYSFPIFNIADACITIGVIALLLFSRQQKIDKPV